MCAWMAAPEPGGKIPADIEMEVLPEREAAGKKKNQQVLKSGAPKSAAGKKKK